jgi:ADP-heptose:LPS heptosyltransferase
MPAIVAIRKKFPDAQLDVLTNAGGTNLVSLSRLLSNTTYNEIIDYLGYKPGALLRLLKSDPYDLVIELPQDQASLASQLRNMIFFRLARIRSGFGWQVNTIFRFRQAQERHLKFISERTRLLNILNLHGIQSGGANVYPLEITSDDQSVVDSVLQPVDRTRPNVGIVPGAKRPQNRYPLERFKDIAYWLVDKGYNVLVIGGGEDSERGASISTRANIHNFCGRLTPVQSAVLLSRCVATISNDTGPMHLSYAVGTPVIGLFSSRDFPNKWFPPEDHIAIRNDDVHCSLCFSETCSNNICMQGIPIEKVKDAFLQVEAALR